MALRTESSLGSFGTLVAACRTRAEQLSETRAFTFLAEGETESACLSYADLDRRARAVAARLQERGLAGERVLLLFPPDLEFVVAFFGCLYAGAVAVPAYPPASRRSLPRLQTLALDARPAAALTTAEGLPRFQALAAALPELRSLDWIATDALPDELAASWREPDLPADSVAFLQYTSGSTSSPKGVMVTHANLLHNESMIQRAFEQSEESVVVGWLPLYHDMGLIGNVLQPLFSGGSCVLMAPVAFLQSPLRWLKAISRYRATTSGGPNFAYDLCVRKIAEADRAELDLSSWKVAYSGAEPVRAETLERFAQAFAGCGFRSDAFYPCYGLAEATLFVTGSPVAAAPVAAGFAAEELARHRSMPDSGGVRLVGCGAPWLEQRLEIVDPETGARGAAGSVGEIWVSGPSVARGYWNRPDVTESTFRARLADDPEAGPFLRTGDLGFVHDGQLFVTGRLKDLIIIRGRNLYPQDVELTAERAHFSVRPGCGAAFAVEVEGEERLVAVCELERHPSDDPAAIAQAVRRGIVEEHEVAVHDVVLVRTGTIPKTSSGKIRRQECHRSYVEGKLEEVFRSGAASAVPGREEAWTVPSRRELEETPRELRPAALERWLRAAAAQALRLAPADILADRPLVELGLDSLSAAELRHRIAADLGLEVSFADLLESGLASLASDAAGRLGDGLPTLALGSGGEAGEAHPLSYGQRAIWFAERATPVPGVYNIAAAARLSGPADPTDLRRAFARLVARHEALRTAFFEIDGEPRQRVEAGMEPDFQEIDARGWDADRIAAGLRDEAFRPFDLEAGRPLRVRLLDREDGRILLVAVHHLVADLRSLEVIAGELASETDLPSLPARYRDFVAWQERLLAGPSGEALAAWWHERLGEEAPPLSLADRPRSGASAGPGAVRRRLLPPDLAAGVGALASSRGATPFAVLLAAFQVLLQRTTGERDVRIGSPAAGRTLAETADLVGYFVNPLVLRTEIGDAAFGDHVSTVRRSVLDALERQDYPFARLVEQLQPERLPGVTPLFQVLFVYQRPRNVEMRALPALAMGEAGERLALGPWELEAIPLPDRPAHLDLTLEACELNGGLACAVHYRADLIDEATAGRLLGHFETLLRGAVAEPGMRLASLPLLTEPERQQIRVWSAGEPLPADGLCLHELVAEQAARTPKAVAVIDGDERVSYGELRTRVADLAARLRGLGVGPEVRVAVCLGRSRRLVEGVLAVLEAGGAYVPLDPAHPAERLAWVLEDSGAALLLTEPALEARLPRTEIPRVLSGEAVEAGEELAETAVGPGNLAYVIYTSGSTGRAKGVAIQHRSAVALVRWARRTFAAEDLGRVLASTSLGFDLSVFELFAPLAGGGAVVMAENALALPSLPAAGEVRLVNTVPSAAAELARSGALPPSVRAVCLAGEPLPPDLVERLYGLGIERVYNLYGPTETTTYSTGGLVERGMPGMGGMPSIGRPLAGEQVWILDAEGSPVPVGVAGEVFLGGAGVARGYLGRPDLTAERFVPDPFSGEGARLYRTGDLARWRQDGTIEFLGRADHQVKVRGFRIEPGEIEAWLQRHASVREAAVLAREVGPAGLSLVAWVAPGEAPPAELVAHLRCHLPEYMVPSFWVGVDALPRTPNGKLDRRALPDPETGPESAPARPANPLEEVLTALWTEVLGRAPGSVQESFFELGGHSLLAVRLLARVRQALEVDLPVSALFEAPTVARLALEIEAARGSAPRLPAPPIRRVPREDGLPLAAAQRRIWFLQQLAPESPAYNMAAAVRLRGPLDREALKRAVAELGRRHEPLRTVFPLRDRQPVQEIVPGLEIALREIELGGMLPEERAWEEAVRPFDLETAPLARFTLMRLPAQDDHLLLVTLHHLIADGGSIGVLLEDLAAIYGAFAAGEPSPLPELELQYVDYAVWQQDHPSEAELERQLAWWRSRLAGLEPLELPTDRPRAASDQAGGPGGIRSLALPADVTAAVAELGRREAATPFMILLAGFLILLHRYTGQDDLAVGAPVSQRGRRGRDGSDRLVGMFVNILVLRVDAFGDLIRRVRSAVIESFARQDLPFDRLVAALRPERGAGASQLIQAAFVLQDEPWPAPRAAGLAMEAAEVHNGAAKFDLTLAVARRPEGLAATIEYNSGLFDGATAQRWLGHFASLLRGMVMPGADLLSLPLLSAEERHQLVVEAVDTRILLASGLVHERIARRAAERPDSLAAVSGDATLTYAELNLRANRLARHLRSLGVGPDVRVGVHLGREPELLVAQLAVLKAGGAFVPLEPGLPAERLEHMTVDAGVLLVVTREALTPAGIGGARPVLLDRDAEAIAAHDGAELPNVAGPENLAYVLYTSGSTGRPKGVGVPHSGLLSLVAWHLERYGLAPDHRVSQVAALGFDASVWEIFPALAAGASLWFAPGELRAAPADLLGWMGRSRIDIAFLPTPVAERGLALIRAGATAPAVILTGGDRLRARPVVGAPFVLVNHYGPTEASVVATAGTVEPAEEGAPAPSIGRPIGNVRLHLLGAGMVSVPPGARGEIFLGGPLARGYLGRPDLTAAAFVPDPFATKQGERLYRTGDLARLRQDGRLEFLGRADHQVKVRGVRIELGEVEAALRAHPAVAEAVAGVRERSGETRLAAWFVPAGEPPVSGLELAAFLRERLPEAMVPSAFVPVAVIPLTANGKVDRRALPDPEPSAEARQRQRVAPRTELEQVLAGMWGEVLGIDPERIGVHDGFFDLGGHSLLATELIGVARDAFDLDLPLRALLESPTVAGMAEALLRDPGTREHVESTAGLLLRLASMSEEEAESLLAGSVG